MCKIKTNTRARTRDDVSKATRQRQMPTTEDRTGSHKRFSGFVDDRNASPYCAEDFCSYYDCYVEIKKRYVHMHVCTYIYAYLKNMPRSESRRLGQDRLRCICTCWFSQFASSCALFWWPQKEGRQERGKAFDVWVLHVLWDANTHSLCSPA